MLRLSITQNNTSGMMPKLENVDLLANKLNQIAKKGDSAFQKAVADFLTCKQGQKEASADKRKVADDKLLASKEDLLKQLDVHVKKFPMNVDALLKLRTDIREANSPAPRVAVAQAKL